MRSTAWLVVLAACGSDDKSKVIDAPPMIDAAIDAPLGCTDDTLPDVTDTLIDTQRTNILYPALAICPATDKDRFALATSTGNKSIEVIATMTTGAIPMITITNAGGSAVAMGMPMGANAMRACVANVPSGMYYAELSAAQTSEYQLSIALVPNC